MIRFVVEMMDDSGVLYLLLEVTAEEEVVNLGDSGDVPCLVDTGEVNRVTVPGLTEVQLVHKFLYSVCMICTSYKVCIYISCPNDCLTISLLYGGPYDPKCLQQFWIFLPHCPGVAGEVGVH